MNIIDVLIEQSPALIIAIPLLGAFLMPLVSRINSTVRNIFGLLVLCLTGFFVGILASDVLANGPRLYIFGAKDLAVPMVRILFEVDSMSIFMALITMVLAFITLIYSWSFMKDHDGLDKYYTLVLLLITSTLGMELTGDIFNFFVFLEISCIASCALIAFWISEGEALEAAFKYIVVSAIGALFVLFAIGLLYAQYNALNIATLANVLKYTFLDKIILVLLLVVLGMKAGLVPMHMWLPDSYGRAPPSVTLIIMGATLASFYGVLRVIFTLYGNVLSTTMRFSIPLNVLVGWILITLAIISIIVGVAMALVQSDFMRLIGFSAVAEVGYMFLAIGAGIAALGTPYATTALQGGILHLLNDALDIGLLFLVAGAVYYITKKRSLDDISGLARNMKYTTVFFVIGLLAVVGMPPLNGFASKFLIYESVYQLNPILSIVAILCSILMLAVFVKVFYAVFMGPELPAFKNVTEAPRSMLLAMGVVAALMIFIGLFPNLVIDALVKPAADALLNHAQYIGTVVGGV
ncbi:MAG: NADH:ubiquinone oxidoreductase [Thermoplasmata archaeon]|nr:NADH:ubiquinone oxidoreductase [Thermoplasmata archaeon]MBE3138100.1 NADH:ubiquinone oxidoreductase [Thermoplasmata archaeon]MBE3139674.1 NADH:ubiquinone oxidoreductase [Thermoplasmata archaeon]